MSFTQRPQSLRATFNVDKYNCIYKVEAQRDLLNTQRELACDHIKCILSLRWPAAVEHLYRLHKPGTFYYFLRLYLFYFFFPSYPAYQLQYPHRIHYTFFNSAIQGIPEKNCIKSGSIVSRTCAIFLVRLLRELSWLVL